MCTLIPLVIKVEIMLNRLITTLWRAQGRQRDCHVKLAPSLLLDLERRALDNLLHALAEGFVEDVGGLFVAVGRDFFAVRADEVDDDAPGAHGEAFHFLRFIAVAICVSDARVWEGWVHLREDSLGGDEFDGPFDLFPTCYSLLHLVMLSCVDAILKSGARCGDIYSRPAWWVVFARLGPGASGIVVFVREERG